MPASPILGEFFLWSMTTFHATVPHSRELEQGWTSERGLYCAVSDNWLFGDAWYGGLWTRPQKEQRRHPIVVLARPSHTPPLFLDAARV